MESRTILCQLLTWWVRVEVLTDEGNDAIALVIGLDSKLHT